MAITNAFDLNRRGARASQTGSTQQKPRATTPDLGCEPRIVENGSNAGLLALCKIEAEAREAGTLEELQFLVANETLTLVQARQIFVFRAGADGVRIVTISGLPTVVRTAPLVQCVEGVVGLLGQQAGLLEPREFDFSTYANTVDPSFKVYPFRALLWLPLLSRNLTLLGGMLLAREQDWRQEHIILGRRLAATYSHALSLLLSEPRKTARLALRSLMGRKALLMAGAAFLGAMAFPVSMTTLAPFEIAPLEPFVVAAPFDGVIRSILVDASDKVIAGQPLVQFADTVLRNRADVAQREMLVADARVKKATQLAFEDARGRQELGLAMAELALKTTERDFARDMFDQAIIKAPRAGVAIFSDKQALLGKPAAVGERIMLIGDPARVEVAMDVGVSDAIAIKSGARVKIFLDSDPLRPREAEVTGADYLARAKPGNILAFRVVAKLLDDGKEMPRLGTRGTAQLYGDKVWLAFYLFRRPLSALRQWVGL